MNYLANAITSVFEIAILLYIISNIIEEKIPIRNVLIIVFFTGIANILVLIFLADVGFQHSVFVLLVYLSLKTAFKLDWRKYTVAFAMGSILLVIIELLIVGVIYLITEIVVTSFLGLILCECFAVGILFVLFKYIPIRIFNEFIESRNKWFIIIVLNLYGISSIITFMWYINIEGVLGSIVGILIFVIVAIMINVVIINNGLSNKNNSEKLEIYETYLPIIDDIIDEIRIKQHDYHNHIQTLHALYETSGETAENPASDYLTRLTKSDVWNTLIKIDNKVIMAFLYSKYKQNSQHGIEIEFDIKSFEASTNYNDYELVEMYGVMIDNAVEGALEYQKAIRIMPEDISPKVAIRFYKKEQCFYFETCNCSEFKSSDDIKTMFTHKYSSKKNSNRGLGLTKLKLLANKYQGQVFAEYDVNKKHLCIKLKHR